MEREATAAAGAASENRWEPNFRELVEGLGDAVYTLDLEGRFTWGNEAGLKYLGYEQKDFDEFLGRHFLDLLTPASKEVAIDHFRRSLAGEEISPFFEVHAYHRDGSTLNFEIRASDLYRDGELIGRQGVVRNISAIKQLQEQVSKTSERLALLEERERIMARLYTRFATLASGLTNEDQMLQLEQALGQISAQKHGLSEGDIEILSLIAVGKTNREIAEVVHLSPHTIKDRVGRILKSMGAATRAEAAAMAIRDGLVVGAAPDQGSNTPPSGLADPDPSRDA